MELEEGWASGWDGRERAQLRRWARLPLSQKSRWLEEMQAYAGRVRESKKTS